MTIISASTQFTIQQAELYSDEGIDITILPNTTGVNALRELHYPEDYFPPIVYPDWPDKWENFDTAPLTARPMTPVEMTLAGNQAMKWPGYNADRPVKEYWIGNDNRSRVTMEFLRRLAEFYFNPPHTLGIDGYITWWPKDRTVVGYNILIESISIDGTDLITFQYPAIVHSLAPGQMIFTFRIIGVAS